MAKIQFTISKDEQKKAEVAAYFSSVVIEEAVEVGKEISITASFRSGNALINFGRKLETVSGNELDALKKARAEKEKAAAAKK